MDNIEEMRLFYTQINKKFLTETIDKIIIKVFFVTITLQQVMKMFRFNIWCFLLIPITFTAKPHVGFYHHRCSLMFLRPIKCPESKYTRTPIYNYWLAHKLVIFWGNFLDSIFLIFGAFHHESHRAARICDEKSA